MKIVKSLDPTVPIQKRGDEEESVPSILYLDFSRTLDRVSNNLLPSKEDSFGTGDSLLKLLEG